MVLLDRAPRPVFEDGLDLLRVRLLRFSDAVLQPLPVQVVRRLRELFVQLLKAVLELAPLVQVLERLFHEDGVRELDVRWARGPLVARKRVFQLLHLQSDVPVPALDHELERRVAALCGLVCVHDSLHDRLFLASVLADELYELVRLLRVVLLQPLDHTPHLEQQERVFPQNLLLRARQRLFRRLLRHGLDPDRRPHALHALQEIVQHRRVLDLRQQPLQLLLHRDDLGEILHVRVPQALLLPVDQLDALDHVLVLHHALVDRQRHLGAGKLAQVSQVVLRPLLQERPDECRVALKLKHVSGRLDRRQLLEHLPEVALSLDQQSLALDTRILVFLVLFFVV